MLGPPRVRDVREVLRRARRTAPSPDGVPYSVWRNMGMLAQRPCVSGCAVSLMACVPLLRHGWRCSRRRGGGWTRLGAPCASLASCGRCFPTAHEGRGSNSRGACGRWLWSEHTHRRGGSCRGGAWLRIGWVGLIRQSVAQHSRARQLVVRTAVLRQVAFPWARLQRHRARMPTVWLPICQCLGSHRPAASQCRWHELGCRGSAGDVAVRRGACTPGPTPRGKITIT